MKVTYEQLKLMVDFMMSNPDVAKGFVRTAHGRYQKRKKWEEISRQLNSVGLGARKTPDDWCKYWNDYKCRLKRKSMQIKNSCSGARGVLDDIEHRLITVIGPNFDCDIRREEIKQPTDLGFEDFTVTSPPLVSAKLEVLLHEESPESTAGVTSNAKCEEPQLPTPPSTVGTIPCSINSRHQRRPIKRRTIQTSHSTTENDSKKMLVSIEAKKAQAALLRARAAIKYNEIYERKVLLEEEKVSVLKDISRSLHIIVQKFDR